MRRVRLLLAGGPLGSTILTWGAGFFSLPVDVESLEEHLRYLPTIAHVNDGAHVGKVYLMALPGSDLEAVRRKLESHSDIHDGYPYGPSFPLDRLAPTVPGGFSVESYSGDYTLTAVPRVDLGVLCVARTNFRDGRESLDDACRSLSAATPPAFALRDRAPAESTEATAVLAGREVTVRIGPGFTLPSDHSPSSLTWGCFRPATIPGDPKFFSDRPSCWVSTSVSVTTQDAWPADPARWLYPEETLIEGVVGQDSAWVLSDIVSGTREVRARVARRTSDGAWVCTSGQRLVPGDDPDRAIARVRGLCSGFTVK